MVHFVSGFQIVGFSNLVLSFQFWFWRWSKFWLIVACNYLASLLVKSVWRRFFSSALFVVGFAGFLNRLNFVSKVSGLVKSGFQNWLGCRVYRDMISSAKIRANFILVLWSSFLAKILARSFWFLLKIKVRAIIFSVLWRWFWLSISKSCVKPSNKACTRRWGFGAIFKHFSTLLVFSVWTAFRRPPQRR